MSEIIYKELSYIIVGQAMKVHSALGYGFLEKVNEKGAHYFASEKGPESQNPASNNSSF